MVVACRLDGGQLQPLKRRSSLPIVLRRPAGGCRLLGAAFRGPRRACGECGGHAGQR